METTTHPDAHVSPSQALELVRAELLAMDPRTLLPVNLDVGACALSVLGSLKYIREHRDLVVEIFGERGRAIDRLEVVAQAALSAHASYLAAESGKNIQPLVDELTDVRDALVAELKSLIARKLVDRGVLGALSGLVGFKNLCIDSLQLVSIFQTYWPAIEAHTWVRHADFAKAETLADQLIRAIAVREEAGRAAAADLRQRAYTLLLQTYDDVRQSITYVRWKRGDYDLIAPSLWANRGGRRRQRGREEPPTEVAPGAPPAVGMRGAPALADADEVPT